MSDEKELTKVVKDLVDKGATTAEEIHRGVADLPIKVLEEMGLFEKTTQDVKKIQETSIGALYDFIRDVNHKVTGLAADVLEEGKPEKGKSKKA